MISGAPWLRGFFRQLPALLCAGMLAACAGTRPLEAESDPTVENDLAAAEMPATHLPEPRQDELVVVINNSSGIGNHAGFFVGRRLSDPAGSYRFIRSQVKGWKRPTLNDYIAYQLVDGERVQSYRFTLSEADLSAIAARLPAADAAAPLFCAAAVNNALAGIGPFAKLAPVNWTSPAAVAEQLDAILAANPGVGYCVLPDDSPCTPPVQVRVAAPR
jgi:hypothetical protein